MNIVYYLICFALLCFNINSAQAFVVDASSSDSVGYDSSSLSSVESNSFLDISYNLPQNGVKLAAVRFISGQDALKIVVNTEEIQKCDTSLYPFDTASNELNNCKTVAICKEGNVEKKGCASCKSNMTLSNGKCSCNRGVFKYDPDTNSCPLYAVFSEAEEDKCEEVQVNGKTKDYYAACVCPADYQYECDGTGQTGAIATCTINGVSKSVSCTCTSEYQNTCSGGSNSTGYVTTPPTGNDKCYDMLRGETRYKTCSTMCDYNAGYFASAEDWWNQCVCGNDEEMVAFEVTVNANDVFGVRMLGDFNVDWGDGKSDTYTARSEGDLTHTYTSAGTYRVKITADQTGYVLKGIFSYTPKITKLIKVNLPSVRDYTDLFNSAQNMSGSYSDVILHEGLETADFMFENTYDSNMTGSVPTLPSTLKSAEGMFRQSSVSGEVYASSIPASLTKANNMFSRANELTCCTEPNHVYIACPVPQCSDAGDTCSDYPLTACPTGASSCSSCNNGSTTKFMVNECVYDPDGGSSYINNGTTCVEGTYEVGDTYYYKGQAIGTVFAVPGEALVSDDSGYENSYLLVVGNKLGDVPFTTATDPNALGCFDDYWKFEDDISLDASKLYNYLVDAYDLATCSAEISPKTLVNNYKTQTGISYWRLPTAGEAVLLAQSGILPASTKFWTSMGCHMTAYGDAQCDPYNNLSECSDYGVAYGDSNSFASAINCALVGSDINSTTRSVYPVYRY